MKIVSENRFSGKTYFYTIASRPMFTIAIGDKHVDEKTDVTWTCEVLLSTDNPPGHTA